MHMNEHRDLRVTFGFLDPLSSSSPLRSLGSLDHSISSNPLSSSSAVKRKHISHNFAKINYKWFVYNSLPADGNPGGCGPRWVKLGKVPIYLVPIYLVPIYLVPIYLVPIYLVPIYLVPIFGLVPNLSSADFWPGAEFILEPN